jgi:hypothetical protein
MRRDKIVRFAIVVGLVLVVALAIVAIGAPMIGMIRAHLGI